MIDSEEVLAVTWLGLKSLCNIGNTISAWTCKQEKLAVVELVNKSHSHTEIPKLMWTFKIPFCRPESSAPTEEKKGPSSVPARHILDLPLRERDANATLSRKGKKLGGDLAAWAGPARHNSKEPWWHLAGSR